MYVCDTYHLRRPYRTRSYLSSLPGVETPGYYQTSSGRFFIPSLGPVARSSYAPSPIARRSKKDASELRRENLTGCSTGACPGLDRD